MATDHLTLDIIKAPCSGHPPNGGRLICTAAWLSRDPRRPPSGAVRLSNSGHVFRTSTTESLSADRAAHSTLPDTTGEPSTTTTGGRSRLIHSAIRPGRVCTRQGTCATTSSCAGSTSCTQGGAHPKADMPGITPTAGATPLGLDAGVEVLCRRACSTPKVVQSIIDSGQIRSAVMSVKALVLVVRTAWG